MPSGYAPLRTYLVPGSRVGSTAEVVMAGNHARAERAALCDLLTELGPDEPTLCEGWTTRDLAAHLLVRERRPDAAAGIALSPLAGHTKRVQRETAARPYPELIEALRRPPAWSPLSLGPIDRAANTLEFFLHHEDVRRAQPHWRPRPLPSELAAALWTRIRPLARLRLRRFPAALAVVAPGFGEVRAGRGGEPVRLTGDPAELAIFLSGRQPAASVELAGPAELTDRLRTARLGL